MRRVTSMLFVLSIASAVASVVVVVTAPDSNPTPSDSLWGHVMPTTQQAIDLALIAAAAIIAGVAVFLRLPRLRLLAGVIVVVTSTVGLYFLSVVAWRLHSPVSAGNL
jgi:hypothetical protein